jgi:hypothetical protein
LPVKQREKRGKKRASIKQRRVKFQKKKKKKKKKKNRAEADTMSTE